MQKLASLVWPFGTKLTKNRRQIDIFLLLWIFLFSDLNSLLSSLCLSLHPDLVGLVAEKT